MSLAGRDPVWSPDLPGPAHKLVTVLHCCGAFSGWSFVIALPWGARPIPLHCCTATTPDQAACSVEHNGHERTNYPIQVVYDVHPHNRQMPYPCVFADAHALTRRAGRQPPRPLTVQARPRPPVWDSGNEIREADMPGLPTPRLCAACAGPSFLAVLLQQGRAVLGCAHDMHASSLKSLAAGLWRPRLYTRLELSGGQAQGSWPVPAVWCTASLKGGVGGSKK